MKNKQKNKNEAKYLYPNILPTRLLVLLAQNKASNNSKKTKNKIRQVLYLLYQDNKIT